VEAGCQWSGTYPEARFVRTIPWAEDGQWLKADTHVHTTFSDGGVELGELVNRAAANGVQVLALTDHADIADATSDEYFAALEQARKEHPEMVLLAGLEWNVPPWGGAEHAAILLPTSMPERKVLREFQVLFDDANRDARDPDLALKALDWLSRQPSGDDARPLVIYNHPCRKREDSAELVELLSAWRGASSLAIGFEGGPGHQASEPIGDYKHKHKTIDRWDPMAAEVGGAWDQVLARGVPVWGAVATSDFHQAEPNQPGDYWPGQFSETWLFAPDKTAKGALAALRAGSFFGVHGQIARAVQLRVLAAGLSREAIAGEAILAPPGSEVIVTLHLQTPLVDWQGEPNRIDEVELIATSAGEANVVARRTPTSDSALRVALLVPEGGVTLRARGRREGIEGDDLLFYTNPIQVFTAASSLSAGSESSPPIPRAPVADHDAGYRPSRESAAAESNVNSRSVPAWLPLGFIVAASLLASLIDHWQLAIRRRFAAVIQDSQSFDEVQAIPRGWRRYFLALLLGFVFLAVYGSLVPLRPAVMDWPTAADRFQTILQQPLSMASRSDWATNLLLFVPIGFLGTGLALGARPGDWRRGAGLVIVVLGSAALSLTIEFAQLFVADRTSSQNDVVAETLGALVGAIAWLLLGPVLISWLGRALHSSRPRERAEHLLEAYVALVVLYMLLPLDLTLRPAELVDKWQDGRINLVPFADLVARPETVFQQIGDMVLLASVGMLAALWRWPVWERVRPLAPSLSAGLLAVAAIETAQLFVTSRFSSTTDLITGSLAVLFGWLIADWLVRANAARLRPAGLDRQHPAFLLAAAIAYALVAGALFCLPFDRWATPEEAGHRLGEFLIRPPLASLYWGTEANAVSELLRKMLIAAPLGGLLALVATSRRFTLVATCLVMILWAFGIEFVQVAMPPHIADYGDLLLLVLGSVLAFIPTSYLLGKATNRLVIARWNENRPDSVRSPHSAANES
jgi:glycopeptide antibiotics resistance protein